jgi:hypothetical protein
MELVKRSEKDRIAACLGRATRVLSQARNILQILVRSRTFEYADAEQDEIPATVCFIGCLYEILTNTRNALYATLSGKVESSRLGFNWTWFLALYKDQLYQETARRR